MGKKIKLLRVVTDTPRSILDEINKMNDAIYRYFSRISRNEYSKRHISINNKIIYNVVFKTNIVNEFLRKTKITIVDIGAGCCDLEKKLMDVLSSNQDILIIATDISSNMIKNSKIVPEKYPFNIQFVLADATYTGLQSDCSDITFVINVLPYIEDVRTLLSELYRITRTKGIIVIVNPIKGKFNFWEKYFDEIKIYFHEKLENIFDLERFQLVENISIDLNPIQYMKMIKVPIAKLMILKVLK